MTLRQKQEDDKLYRKLASLQANAQNLSSKEIEQILAQLSIDIEFLDEQVKADIKRYSTEQLATAFEKISYSKEMAKILNSEMTKRTSQNMARVG